MIFMDIHNAIINIHNLITDIYNCTVGTNNYMLHFQLASSFYINIYIYAIMDIHEWIIDIHNWIMDVHNWN